MIDYYSLEKIAEEHRMDAVKAAAQDRQASQAAAARRKRRQAAPSRPRRTAGRSVAARLRALAFASVRRLEAAAEQGDG